MSVATRFSLLLLEPGEIYFDDFSATLYRNPEERKREHKANASAKDRGAANRRRTSGDVYDDEDDDVDAPVEGRVKICSKSLVFVPSGNENLRRPLIKFPLNDCQDIQGIGAVLCLELGTMLILF
jgi:factor associated with neutral sphingomyelinase activation